jgi:hypothetical protein
MAVDLGDVGPPDRYTTGWLRPWRAGGSPDTPRDLGHPQSLSGRHKGPVRNDPLVQIGLDDPGHPGSERSSFRENPMSVLRLPTESPSSGVERCSL